MPWNPREKLQDQFELIEMDQRNAGLTAPITKTTTGTFIKKIRFLY